MALSGTTSFTVTRDQIIQEALEQLGVLQDGESAGANDITTCAFTLNMLVKAMASRGIPIWAIQTTAIPLVSGTATYTVGPSGAVVAHRPIRIYQMYIQDSQGNSWPVTQISKQAYDYFSLKATPGIPNQVYYEPLLTDGKVYTYPVINQTGYTLYISVQRQLMDMSAGSNNFDYPQDMFLMISCCLARELLGKYVVPEKIANKVKEAAARWETSAWDFEQEEADTTFSPSMQAAGGGWNNG